MLIAIDTGGTFTDLVLYAPEGSGLVLHKVPSTPDDPSRALVQGVVEIARLANVGLERLEILVHGTTVATNAVLERRGAKVVFLTTRGFRDVLHIQRQDRPKLYEMRRRRAEPLVPRRLRLEVAERVRHDGEIGLPLDRQELVELCQRLRRENVEAVAVGLLHSHANPTHELEVGRIVAEELPDCPVSLSHELVAEEREYERFSTCAMNAYVQPTMARYLGHIAGRLEQAGIKSPLLVMKSSGGVMAADAAARQSVHTILSGPAGGVVAGVQIALTAGRHRNLITADMGGTSLDVAVIHEGRAAMARDAEMAGLALRVPMLDIHTVGAGGGSIGWRDAGGALRVGPQSAGADPGPACYGRGGRQPTVTDANLVLGRLSANSPLAGTVRLDEEAARRAIHDELAQPLGLSLERAAEGMIQVVNTTMTAAIRKLTVERGHDPREFALCPFGGAGPLHASELARELGVAEIVVPVAPGVTSALGLLMSHLREDKVRSLVGPLARFQAVEIEGHLTAMEAELRASLVATAGAGRALVSQRRLGLRYIGQGHELPVELSDEPLDLTQAAEAFHAGHQRQYGFRRDDEPIELVNLWVSVTAAAVPFSLPCVPVATSAPEPIGERSVVFAGRPWATPIYARERLGATARIAGPAIVEQFDTTILLWPGDVAEVDRLGQLIVKEAGR